MATALGSVNRAIWVAIRPHQWAKNFLVFAAPAGAGMLNEGSTIARSLGAVTAFCAASSAGYLVNDVLDRSNDQAHPTKTNRPIAAGHVPVRTALGIAAALASVALVVSVAIRTEFAIMIVAYLALTAAYSTFVKRVPVMEMTLLAGLFVLRAHAGAVAVDVASSGWFLLVVSAVGTFVVVRKRSCELHRSGPATRPVLEHYRRRWLKYAAWTTIVVAIGGHMAWAFATSGDVAGRAIATVAFGATVVLYNTATSDDDASGDPVVVVLRDPRLMGLGLIWALAYIGAAL